MNNCSFIGRLTKDPELRFTPGNGTAVVNFILAVPKIYKRENEPDADFIPVVFFGKTAETIANYTSKGQQLGVVGRYTTSTYDDKDGVRRYKTEIVGTSFSFVGSKNTSQQQEDNNGGYNTPDYGNDVTPIDNEDIPF